MEMDHNRTGAMAEIGIGIIIARRTIIEMRKNRTPTEYNYL